MVWHVLTFSSYPSRVAVILPCPVPKPYVERGTIQSHITHSSSLQISPAFLCHWALSLQRLSRRLHLEIAGFLHFSLQWYSFFSFFFFQYAEATLP